ncbi:unnamed protein product [Staurois parvus]|uniref:Uncharacterized protein n=1 Tax=Staurois parvus TaxID=386267 RepID=A0ABN9CFE6_9NEOB|nr:unnamed protein product [Staurois parvus]
MMGHYLSGIPAATGSAQAQCTAPCQNAGTETWPSAAREFAHAQWGPAGARVAPMAAQGGRALGTPGQWSASGTAWWSLTLFLPLIPMMGHYSSH